ncbi:electron transfer flavoprotein subunit beta [Bosea sp. 117]|uniref:electron transfer flavoprotein subunit beta n=1 Tax=Bosea sp. 117 TaxID=1125973 RepID=UPI000493F031|nr:electron transfer flavoprotein subunit beta [Bosea sp. 117]
MKVVVLVSAGRHPVTGRASPVPVELQAIRLARLLGAAPSGLHAGPKAEAVRDTLGHGLAGLAHLAIPDGDDPLPSLVGALTEMQPDLILAGRVGCGGEDSGQLPYLVADALGLPILSDAALLAPGEAADTLVVDQALPKGVRRRVTLRLPAILTVHPAAPTPLPFAFAQARSGRVDTRPGIAAPRPATDAEQRPYRPRPKLIAKAAAGASAADRLKAATETAAAGGRLLVDPPPDEAAREIIAHLREIGVLRGNG